MDDIKLNYLGDKKPLPRGIKLILLGEKYVFARWHLGRFIVLSDEEQIRLGKEYVSPDNKNI